MSKSFARAALIAALLFSQIPEVVRSQEPSAPANRPRTPMSQYFMVFLRRGPAWTAEVTPATRAVSQGHMENIQRLTSAGKLVVAGPFLEQSGERALAGLFLLRVETLDEAKAVVDSDPAVKAGRFVYEIVPWMGPTNLKY
jgi:uncharacterized protein